MLKPRFSTILLLTLLWGQTAAAEDLYTIYQLAKEYDAELQVAESDYLAAIESVPLAESANLPQVSFEANARYNESDNSATGDNDTDSIGYSVNLTQSLYNTDNRADINAAEASVLSELANLEAARQDLILRVTNTYFGILAAQDNVDFAYAERNAIARQLEQAQKRFEVGLIAITDVQEAQARFDSAEAQVILAENQLETAYEALVLITGVSSIRTLARVEEQLALDPPEPADTESWVGLAQNNNRALISARENLNVARFERDRSSNNRLPTVDLFATYSDTDANDDIFDDYDQEDITVGVTLQVPIYNGGRLGSERLQADANLRSAQNSLLLTARQVSQQTRTAYLDVISGISQVRALEQALESSNVALEATQAGFEVGTRTSVDVLVSLQETFRAQRDYARARYDYLINTILLKQAAGTLTEEDLIDINRRLTP